MTVFETDRLQLREMTLEDAAFILELVNTPEWYKYIGDRGIRTIDEARDYIQEMYLESYLTHGFGAYVMIRKDNGEAVGSCGLYKRSELEHPDIGFAILSKYGKKGYAYEASKEMLEYAENSLSLETIFAITIQENYNSIALLEKLGLKKIDTVTIEGDDAELLLFSN